MYVEASHFPHFSLLLSLVLIKKKRGGRRDFEFLIWGFPYTNLLAVSSLLFLPPEKRLIVTVTLCLHNSALWGGVKISRKKKYLIMAHFSFQCIIM